MSLLRLLLIAFLSIGLFACQRNSTPVDVQANDPHLAQQNELEKGNIDLSNIVTVRLLSDGKRVEISTILPAVISSATVSGQAAKTIFRLNTNGTGLILFSRDILNGKSNRIEISLDDLQARKSFTFPIVQADGSLKEKSFAFEQIVRPNL